MGRHKASGHDTWWEGSTHGSETLAKTDHSSCFLTFQQREGCLPLDPEICHHSSTTILVQTQIDSVLIALISSFWWQSYNAAIYFAAPTTGQLAYYYASFDGIFVVSVSLALLMGCADGWFQQHSLLLWDKRAWADTWAMGPGDFLSVKVCLTQVFLCSTLVSTQWGRGTGFVLLVWIALFIRIALLVINVCRLYKSGFEFLFEAWL